MNPEISFILVNWNTRDLTLQCIRSIVDDCRESAFEIIVADNASSDGSANAIETTYPNVRLLRNSENLGFARGNNEAIKSAMGDFVCLINTDVVIRPGCLPELLRYLRNHPDAGLIAPRVLNADGSVQITVAKEITLFNTLMRAFFLDNLFPSLTGYSQRRTEPVDTVMGCFWLIRLSVIRQIGLLDDAFFFYGEDRDYCRRIREAHWKIIYHPEASIYHFSGSSSKGSPYRYSLLLEKSRILYWKKYYGPVSFQAYMMLRVVYHLIRIVTNGIAFITTFARSEKAKIKITLSWYSILLHSGKLRPIRSIDMTGIL